MNDIEKTCKDCEKDFTITVQEQTRFAELKDDDGRPLELPKRCFACRKQRKANQGQGRDIKKFPHNKNSFSNKKGKRWDQQ